MTAQEKIAGQYALDEQIGEWTVAQLLQFMNETPLLMPKIGLGVSLKEHMKHVTPWEDDRDVEEIIREIYDARTLGRNIDL